MLFGSFDKCSNLLACGPNTLGNYREYCRLLMSAFAALGNIKYPIGTSTFYIKFYVQARSSMFTVAVAYIVSLTI